jgi:hypothetical protein
MSANPLPPDREMRGAGGEQHAEQAATAKRKGKGPAIDDEDDAADDDVLATPRPGAAAAATTAATTTTPLPPVAKNHMCCLCPHTKGPNKDDPPVPFSPKLDKKTSGVAVPAGSLGRGLHSFTSRLNLSRV